MGRIKKGILGGFSGKVGTVIGANWRGIDYIRALPKKSKKPATAKQLSQQNKMTLLRGFLLALDEIIEPCFQNNEKYTPMNDALSYNLKNSITGNYPTQSISFPQFLYSKGDLMSCWTPKAISTTIHAVDFSWDNGNFSPLRAADDQVTLVVYSPATNNFCHLTNAARRADKQARLIIPENFSGHTLHCYISFYSADRNLASTNEYLGEIEAL